MATSLVAPHDLLMLHDTRSLQFTTLNPPSWVVLALQQTPLVVVRRAPAMGDQLPVGIRGQSRSERWAAFLRVTACGYERIAPEHLVATQAWTRSQRLRQIEAIQVLAEIAPYLQASRLIWGRQGAWASNLPAACRRPQQTATSICLYVRRNCFLGK